MIRETRNRLERLKGERDALQAERDRTRADIARHAHHQACAEKARDLVRAVAQATQQQLEYHISEIVSLALAAVFPAPYALRLRFALRRNRTESDLRLVRPGAGDAGEDEGMVAQSATGGGVVDVVAFALRVAMLSLHNPSPRKTILLDEPFRFLSRDLHPRASAMLQEIATRLGYQIIMVSHSADLVDCADRVFRVAKKGGVSHVTCQ